MNKKPNITPGQLAIARGCDTDNLCFSDCVETASYDLEHFDQLGASQVEMLAHADWIAEQHWVE